VSSATTAAYAGQSSHAADAAPASQTPAAADAAPASQISAAADAAAPASQTPAAADAAPAGQTPAAGLPGAAVDVARLRVAIARLSRRLRKHELAGLTPTKLSALATIDHAGPVRLGDLAAAERIAPSTLTRLVSTLEECGYVQRCAVPGDARASTLAITDLGHAALERIRQETTSQLRESLLMLPPDQLAALAAALPALEHLADADPGDPRSR
jgi:DNA-binding MarR family transcriptional regulator